jgi:cobalt-zinc-cadmium efflux system protein
MQAVGGLVTGSLALLADAGHLLTDIAGIAAALIGGHLAGRPATTTRTFGLQRAEVLAAFANAVLLFGIAGYFVVEAAHRWSSASPVDGTPMLVLATVGALANGASVLVLRGSREESLNLRGAYLEVLGDLLGSLAVVLAAVVIALTGWTRADVVASAVIAVMILPRAWSLLRDVLDVLLEATPRHVDLHRVRAHMLGVTGVIDVHDLHAWTITSGVPVLSAHVTVDSDCIARGRSGQVLDALGACLGHHFDVEHCTFQLEPEGHREHEASHHH